VTMTYVLSVAGFIIGVATLAVAPLFLPWPWEVRWIMAAKELNPLVALNNAHRQVQLEEVVLVTYTSEPAALVLVVEPETTTRGREELVGGPCSVGDLAALDGWHSARSPLLLVKEAGGVATLRGPHRAITGLHESHHHPTPVVA
jgi:hypothetical protein